MKPALNSITKHLQKQLKHKLYAQDFQSNLSIYPDKIGNSTISHYINHTNSTKFFNRITKLSTSTQKSKEKSRVFTRNPSSITNKPRTNHTVISTRNPSQNVPKKPWVLPRSFPALRRWAAAAPQPDPHHPGRCAGRPWRRRKRNPRPAAPAAPAEVGENGCFLHEKFRLKIWRLDLGNFIM